MTRLNTIQSVFLLLTLQLIAFHVSWAQEEECGAQPPEGYGKFFQERVASMLKTRVLQANVSLPVQHHVSRTSSGGSPAVSSSDIRNVMEELNDKYAPMNISFYEYSTTRYVDKSSWNSEFSKSSDSQLRQYEVANAINIFYFDRVVSGSNSICGYAKFPGSGNRIVLKASCSQNGSTSAHEIGHYFSILHTHSTSRGEELVKRTNCSRTGDLFCDTPADPRLSSSIVNSSCRYTGSARDANGDRYAPDVRNIMSYTRKSCRSSGEFTGDQRSAIIASLNADRDYLLSPGNQSGKVGITSIGDRTTTHGDRRAMPFTMSESGTLESIAIHVTGGAGDLQLGVYANSNGAPGSRIGRTAVTDVRSSTGWQTVALESPVNVSSGQTIWLAWILSNNPGVQYTSGSPGRYRADGTSWSSGRMPSSYGSGSQSNWRYSIYANYTKGRAFQGDNPTDSSDDLISEPTASIRVFPNPSNADKINITFESNSESNGLLELINLDGKVLVSKEVSIATGSNQYQLNTSLLNGGLYFVRTTSFGQVSFSGLVVITR